MTLSFADHEILSVLKDRVNLLYSRSQELNQQAQQYITLMSAAMALAGGFKVFERKHDNFDTALLILMIGTYATGFIIAVNVSVRHDYKWKYPFSVDNIMLEHQRLIHRGSRDIEYLLMAMSTYVYVLKDNQTLINSKVNNIRFAHRLMLAVLVLAVTTIVYVPTP